MTDDPFRKFAHSTSTLVGAPGTFFVALLVVLGWAVTGPIFHFSDTWQLVINTGTTIITFLMVFLIQNSQNRDARALHLKLDELLRAVSGARTGLVNLESLPDDQLLALQKEFERLQEKFGVHEAQVATIGREIEARKRDAPKASKPKTGSD